MKKLSRKSFLLSFVLAAMVMLLCFSASAESIPGYNHKPGYKYELGYTYTVNGGEATIINAKGIGSANVTVPSALGGYPVTQIGERAFEKNRYIKTVVIPDSVVSLGDYAFASCDILKKVTISSKLKSIGERAFYDCAKLTDVVIPNSVETIGAHAFSCCDGIKSITIPAGVKNISGPIFAGCTNLAEIIVDKNNLYYTNDEYGVLFNKSKTELIQYPCASTLTSYSVPDGVVSIGDTAFSNCKNLNSITLAESVITLGNNSFSKCYGLTDFVMSNNVTSIGKEAFSYCENLEQITIPASLVSIGKNAFEYCALSNVYAKDIESWLKIKFESGWPHSVNLYLDNQLVTDLVIPEGVDTIGKHAFDKCAGLKSVVIPGSVTVVDDFAFDTCMNLEGVVIQKGVKTINRSVFDSCKKLKKVDLPDSLTTIGRYAFEGCEALTEITIPDSVTVIDHAAFYECVNLERVTLGSGLKTIANLAFMCTDIAEVILPEGIETIGYAAFYICEKLKGVTIPNSVTEIGPSAFGCYETGDEHDTLYRYPDFTITAGRCSAAYQYAKEYGFKFIDNNSNDHNFITSYTKATFENDGKKIVSCKCGEVKSSSVAVAKIGTATLSTTKYTYDGKNKTPKVTVKDTKGKELKKDVDYKVALASTRSNVGKYTAKITLMGDYEGSKNLYFYILPGTTSKITAKKTISTVTLNWNKVTGAAGYRVYRKTSDGWLTLGYVTKLTYTDKGLNPGAKYTYAIKAYMLDGSTKVYALNYKTLDVTTSKLNLGTTSKITATKTSSSVTLTWNKVTGASGYRVFQKIDGKWKKLTDITKLTYTAKSLKANTAYNFAVRAYVLDGKTKVLAPKYKTLSVTTSKASSKPGQVKNVKATPAATTVKLTWSKVSGVKGYYVFSYNAKTKKYTTLGKTSSTTYTVKNLKANTVYSYAVQAYKVSGNKNVYGKVSSVVKVTTLLATPTLKITTTKGKATLTWADISGEKGYVVYMSTKKDSGFSQIASCKANTTKTTKSSLKSGKTYYFKVRAYKSVNGTKTYSAYSSVKSVKVK